MKKLKFKFKISKQEAKDVLLYTLVGFVIVSIVTGALMGAAHLLMMFMDWIGYIFQSSSISDILFNIIGIVLIIGFFAALAIIAFQLLMISYMSGKWFVKWFNNRKERSK
jgi:uncharacterized protein YacL